MVDKRWKIRLKWHKITLYSHLLQGNEEQTLPLDLVFLELFPSSSWAKFQQKVGWEGEFVGMLHNPPASTNGFICVGG
jgi:hypothetical protein